MFLMWLGEQVTERGWHGISIIIFAGIAAGSRTPLPACWSWCAPRMFPLTALAITIAVVLVTWASVSSSASEEDPGQLRQAPDRQQGLRRTGSHLPFSSTCRESYADLRLIDHPLSATLPAGLRAVSQGQHLGTCLEGQIGRHSPDDQDLASSLRRASPCT